MQTCDQIDKNGDDIVHEVDNTGKGYLDHWLGNDEHKANQDEYSKEETSTINEISTIMLEVFDACKPVNHRQPGKITHRQRQHRKHRATKHQKDRKENAPYHPNPTYRAKRNVKISGASVTSIIPQRIKECLHSHLYHYMDKALALQFCAEEMKEYRYKNKRLRVVDYRFHSKDTNELLYAVLESIRRKDRKGNNSCNWEMHEDLYTKEQIVKIFNIEQPPSLSRMGGKLNLELAKYKANQYIMQQKLATKQISIFNSTPWHKIQVFRREENVERITLSVTTKQFAIICNRSVDKEINFIPIVMFYDKRYFIEYLLIKQLGDYGSIGISFTSDPVTSELKVTGIHTDKIDMLQQHILVDPAHDCKCFNLFKDSSFDYLKIGDLNNDKNRIQSLQQRLAVYKKPGTVSLFTWLEEHELSECLQKLVDNGFETVMSLKHINSEEELHQCGITKFGHKKQLMEKIYSLKNETNQHARRKNGFR